MRPNIDIPWSIHGQIKELAQDREQTIEQAYITVLEEGLDHLPTPVLDPESLQAQQTSRFPFGPREVPITNDDVRDINDLTTFIPRLNTPYQPVSFGGRCWPVDYTIDLNDFEQGLARLFNELGRIERDWFTFHQLGGAWVGTGIHNFIHLLRTAEQRLQDASFEIYKTGFAVYIAEIGEPEYLALRLEINSEGEIEEFSLRFLTNGQPVDGSKYSRLLAQMDIDHPDHGRNHEIENISVAPDAPIEIDVVDTIVKEHDGEEWVAGLIFENPLQSHDDLLEHILSEESDEYRNNPAYFNPYNRVAMYDHCTTMLKSHHPASEDHSYKLKVLSIEDISSFLGQSTWNMSFTIQW